MPLLCRNRFHSWADLDILTPSQVCLRSAVWTVAAALCPRFHDMYESLYSHTRHLLQGLDGGDQGHLWTPVGTLQLEQIQAWLLVGHCDFIRHDRYAAILSSTRISRLVQAARFNLQHVGDSNPDVTGPATLESAAATHEAKTVKEEKSRAFWVAFCFDRMVHTLDHCHFMLQDDSVSSPPAFSPSRPSSLANNERGLLLDTRHIHRCRGPKLHIRPQSLLQCTHWRKHLRAHGWTRDRASQRA